MRVLSRHDDAVFGSTDWQPEVLAMLEDHHLVAWSGLNRRRNRFSARLQQFLGAQPDTDVCVLHGRSITNMDSLCHQLERVVPCDLLERRVEGTNSLTELLRSCEYFPGRRPSRYRFFVWNDADVLLRAEPELFARVTDAMAGVAAESEFGEVDGLLIQRAVFIGGPLLESLAHEATSPFNSWASDGSDEPFWQLVSGLERPPVLCRPVDLLMRSPRARSA